jgi:hypothetical protein
VAAPWLRGLAAGLSPRRAGFALGSVHVGFMVEKVILGQIFSEFFGFPLSVSFHRDSPYSNIIWRINIRTIGGRSSETSSLPIDINKNNK